MKIQNAVVFVTGANRGLGLAFAREAVKQGAAKVYAGMRNIDGFNEPGIIAVKLDVTDEVSVKNAAVQHPDVTLVINNAGIAATANDPLAPEVEEQSRTIFETNYYGVMRVTQAFAPVLVQNGEGAIINVLSNASWVPVPYLTAYAISKAAVWSYTNHVRLHLQPQNIQVMGLHVGFIDTDLAKNVTTPKSAPEDVVRQTYAALEAGKSEILADEGTHKLKQSLSAELPAYIDPSILSC